jgi:lysophospholipase L1-like esterase
MFVAMDATVFLADRTPATDGGEEAGVSLYVELAQEEGALLMPSLRQDLAGHPDLLLSDMSHPNADGYAIVARRIFALLEPALVKAE